MTALERKMRTFRTQSLAMGLSVVIAGLLSINPGVEVMADSQVTILPATEESGKQSTIETPVPQQSTPKSHGAKETSKYQIPRLPTAEELKAEPCFEYNESDLILPPGLI